MISKKEIYILIILIFLSVVVGMASVSNLKYILFLITFIFTLSLLYFDSRWFFLVIIILAENGFYLFNVESIPYFFHTVQILGITAFLFYIVNVKTILMKKFLFKKEMNILIILMFISLLSVYITTGQPPIKTLYSTYIYMTYMLYFVIVILFDEYNFEEQFIKILVVSGLVLTIMFTAQYLLSDKIMFLSVRTSLRYGKIRIHDITALIPLVALISTNKLFVSKHKIFYGLLMMLSLFCIFFIFKGRAITIATSIAIILIIILQKKISKRLLLYIVLPFVFAGTIYMIVFNKIELNIIKGILDEYTSRSGTTGFRLEELAYFKELIISKPFFGVGLLNIEYPKSYILSGLQYEYYFVDVGIFGYTAVFGFIGTITSLILLIRAIKKSIELYLMDNSIIFPLAFLSMQVVILFTIYWLLEAQIYYIVMLAYIDIKHKKLKNIIEGGRFENIDDIANCIHSS